MSRKQMTRTLFQFLAFGIFVYQMKHSIEKYFEGPTMPQTSQTLVDEVTMPVLYACQDRQFNHAKGNYYGYNLITFLFGIITDSDDISWKGKFGNRTSTELLQELYAPDYRNYTVVTRTMENNGTMGSTYHDYKVDFILPFGYCMKVNHMEKGISIEGTKRTNLLLVDPFFNNNIRVTEMDNAKHAFGPTGDDTFDVFQYLMKLSIHDKSIHDGKTCTDYTKQDTSYGKCIHDILEDNLMQSYGCLPPWFPNEHGKICEQDKDLEIKDMKAVNIIKSDILDLIKGLELDMFKICLPPCLTMHVHLKELLHTTNRKLDGLIEYNVADDVTVFTDVYAYDIFSLFVDLGSAIGLWLGLCALSILDSLMSIMSKFSKYF